MDPSASIASHYSIGVKRVGWGRERQRYRIVGLGLSFWLLDGVSLVLLVLLLDGRSGASIGLA